jgi:serine O-acetyltransferase
MTLSIQKDQLTDYLSCQLDAFYPDKKPVQPDIAKHIDEALQRMEYCFSHIRNKYFYDGSQSIFNHLHGDQYSMFLYILSNTIFKNNGNINVSSKIFLLNKALHGIDAFYEVELPDIFLFIHPIGTVLGRGKYNDYLIVYQRCGVGSNHDLYPILGKYVTMHPGSSVLGNSKIGDRCSLAAESMIVDKNLEEGSVYFGTPKQCRIRSSNKISYFWK